MIGFSRKLPPCWWLLPLVVPVASAQAQTPEEPQADDDGLYVMSPFEVTTSGDIGYAATETLAGTRLRTELRDVANSISVVNEQFMDDLGATDSEDLLVYTLGTEVGGTQGNFLGAGDASRLREQKGVTPQNNTRVRGLDSADNTRNFFLTDIPWDGFNVSRVELQRGANNVLFGIGSPAGIINTNLKPAEFFTQGQLEYRYAEYNSHRLSADYNVEVLDNELAVRAIGLWEKENYKQEPAYEKDKRVYVAVRYEPEFLKMNGANTSIKVNYEKGEITANRPRTTPPIDRITPWFTEMNKMTYDPTVMHLSDYEEYVSMNRPADYGAVFESLTMDDGMTVANPNYQPWVAQRGGDFFGGPMVIYPDNNSPQQWIIVPGQGEEANAEPTGVTTPYNAWYGIQTYEEWARFSRQPGYQIGAYKERVLTDDSIFDFYNKLLDGDNKKEWSEWDAYNITLSQSFFDYRVGVEYVHDYQEVDRGQEQTFSGSGYAITVDVMETLPPDGSPNPNLGRAMVATRGGNNDSRHSERTTDRVTAYGEFRFSDVMDSESWLTELLGRHIFTGNYTSMEYNVDTLSWERFSAADSFFPAIGSSVNEGKRQVATVNYISPSLLHLDDAAGLDLPNIHAMRNPGDGNITLFDYTVVNESLPVDDLDRYQGWTSVPIDIWNSQTGDKDELLIAGGTAMNH